MFQLGKKLVSQVALDWHRDMLIVAVAKMNGVPSEIARTIRAFVYDREAGVMMTSSMVEREFCVKGAEVNKFPIFAGLYDRASVRNFAYARYGGRDGLEKEKYARHARKHRCVARICGR